MDAGTIAGILLVAGPPPGPPSPACRRRSGTPGRPSAAVVVSDGVPAWPEWIAVAVAVASLALLRHRGRLTWALLVPAQLAIGIALLVD